MSPRLTMGLVSGLQPPADVVRVLRDFDPNLQAAWDYESQRWYVGQRVRRVRLVGYLGDGVRLMETYSALEPVLWLTDWPGALDSRIINLLAEQRAPTQEDKDRLAIERLRKQKRAGDDPETARMRDQANEAAENKWFSHAFQRLRHEATDGKSSWTLRGGWA